MYVYYNPNPEKNHVGDCVIRAFKAYMAIQPCETCLKVKTFATLHPKGLYILATGSHVVALKDGNYMDSWDSGDETVVYYFSKE